MVEIPGRKSPGKTGKAKLRRWMSQRSVSRRSSGNSPLNNVFTSEIPSPQALLHYFIEKPNSRIFQTQVPLLSMINIHIHLRTLVPIKHHPKKPANPSHCPIILRTSIPQGQIQLRNPSTILEPPPERPTDISRRSRILLDERAMVSERVALATGVRVGVGVDLRDDIADVCKNW